MFLSRHTRRSYLLAQSVDIGACLINVGHCINGTGALLDGFVEIGNALLEILELFGKLLDR